MHGTQVRIKSLPDLEKPGIGWVDTRVFDMPTVPLPADGAHHCEPARAMARGIFHLCR